MEKFTTVQRTRIVEFNFDIIQTQKEYYWHCNVRKTPLDFMIC